MTTRNMVTLAVSLVLWSTLGFAQGAATGDLDVTVKDPKGNVVTNATVTAKNPAKALERVTTSNVNGEYRLVLLPRELIR